MFLARPAVTEGKFHRSKAIADCFSRSSAKTHRWSYVPTSRRLTTWTIPPTAPVTLIVHSSYQPWHSFSPHLQR